MKDKPRNTLHTSAVALIGLAADNIMPHCMAGGTLQGVAPKRDGMWYEGQRPIAFAGHRDVQVRVSLPVRSRHGCVVLGRRSDHRWTTDVNVLDACRLTSHLNANDTKLHTKSPPFATLTRGSSIELLTARERTAS